MERSPSRKPAQERGRSGAQSVPEAHVKGVSMSRVCRIESISVFVNPRELRDMADDMEARMAEVEAGERVWQETFNADGLEVTLVADQDWFHRRKQGIPDWDAVAPGPEALERFTVVEDEASEFPETYSGTGWRAAFRIWKVYRDRPNDLQSIGPYDEIPDVELDNMDLTGFMVGWALNAVRQMLGLAPGKNGAVVTIGGPQETVPALGPAGSDLRKVLGG